MVVNCVCTYIIRGIEEDPNVMNMFCYGQSYWMGVQLSLMVNWKPPKRGLACRPFKTGPSQLACLPGDFFRNFGLQLVFFFVSATG